MLIGIPLLIILIQRYNDKKFSIPAFYVNLPNFHGASLSTANSENIAHINLVKIIYRKKNLVMAYFK